MKKERNDLKEEKRKWKCGTKGRVEMWTSANFLIFIESNKKNET